MDPGWEPFFSPLRQLKKMWMHSEGEGKFVNLNRGMMTSIVFNFFFPPSVSMCVCKVIELQLLSPLAVLCEW